VGARLDRVCRSIQACTAKGSCTVSSLGPERRLRISVRAAPPPTGNLRKRACNKIERSSAPPLCLKSLGDASAGTVDDAVAYTGAQVTNAVERMRAEPQALSRTDTIQSEAACHARGAALGRAWALNPRRPRR
jgi:hypothetical protein